MTRPIQIHCIAGLLLLAFFGYVRVESAEVLDSNAINKIPGKRLTLYTDVEGKAIDALPGIFDQSFEQMCEYFHAQPADLADWRMTGFLIKDKDRFKRAGMLPDGLPNFEHGFSYNYILWVYEQPSDYYRRHLILHEGVHGFMNTVLGGCGPKWYMEGMAEMLATHRLKDGRLALNYMPKNRNEAPDWGRVKLIKDAIADGRAQSLRSVIEGMHNLSKETELYAWSWAAAYFLDHHPTYRDRFRQLYRHVRDKNFNQFVFEIFKLDWRQLSDEWQVFITGLEYGYDVARTAIDFSPGKPLPEQGASITIQADRGWQNSGLRLQSGVQYRITALGRYQLADKPKIWWSEPGGVSIRYYQGRPLGILLAAVRPDIPDEKNPCVFLHPITVGLGTTIAPERSGTLFLRINDSAAELDDNAGEIQVKIKPL